MTVSAATANRHSWRVSARGFGIGTAKWSRCWPRRPAQRKSRTFSAVDAASAPAFRQGHHPRADCRIGIGGGTAASSSTPAAPYAARMDERMTVCNMSIEGLARRLIAPTIHFEYLAAARTPQGRGWATPSPLEAIPTEKAHL